MITYQMLKAKGACETQVALFKELFPNGAPLTVETALSVANKFDWDWAISNLLSKEGKAAYEEAEALLLAAYEEAKAPLLAAYEEAEALLLAAYEEAKAPLLAAYEEARVPLWAAYKEARAPLLAAYKEAKAKLFAELYIKENTCGGLYSKA
jgi:hypothetical protein